MITHRRAFTLVEVLLATMVAAVLLAAVSTTLFGTIRLRRAADRLADSVAVQERVARVISADLAGIVAPSGVLAGALLLTSNGSGATARDTIEFFTTTGTVSDSAPWGDLRRVVYTIEDDEQGDGRVLIRTETFNLLATVEDDDGRRVTRLLRGVESLSIEAYGSGAWQESWDSTTVENANPALLRLEIRRAAAEDGTTPAPIVVVRSITTQPRPLPAGAVAPISSAPAPAPTPPPAGPPAGGPPR
jgi:type II secretion system protein J